MAPVENFKDKENETSSDTRESSPPPPANNGKLQSTGKKRSRNGCLNCRRKRRKCSETKPTCEGCKSRGEACQWGIKVSFRPENAQTVGKEHHALFRNASTSNRTYQIVDVTSEIARDYITDGPEPSERLSKSRETSQMDQPTEVGAVEEPSIEDLIPIFNLPQPTPRSSIADGMPSLSGKPFLTSTSPHISETSFEDGIFLPGSQYLELHAELRSRLFDTAQSVEPSRRGSLDPTGPLFQTPPAIEPGIVEEDPRRLAQLSPEQEYTLWQVYITEVAPWIDKFDINRHFELVLPMLAQDAEHLKYSILALSARQIELKENKMELNTSLGLYQLAIHLLTPQLETRSTVVLASSAVLCVLEMLSCSPKAWRRHLDGCAALIQALGITGTCGGLEQAIFWCFARMDVCGALISLEKTLIPIHKWVGGGSLVEDCQILSAHASFDMCANSMVYLQGRVVDLLCNFGRWEQRHSGPGVMYTNSQYVAEWLRLFDLIEQWHRERPQEMRAILVISSQQYDPPRPFPTVLYPNPPAIAGNQLYHTAALLMLKHKPVSLHLAQKPRSMLWHARQICAISISNGNHACWTNSTQPIWIAGQLMSHSSEHKAILELYERVERETGWSTKWRANDLIEYWGDLEA
jgi:hypothetical protein